MQVNAEGLPMIPYELDPSLHAAQPMPEQLDDGFSPPVAESEPKAADLPPVQVPEPADPWLWDKSEF
jgi:hypothetical protein